MTGFCYAITGAVVAVFKVEMSTPTKLYSDPDPFTAYSLQTEMNINLGVVLITESHEMSTTDDPALRTWGGTGDMSTTAGAALRSHDDPRVIAPRKER